MSGNSKKRSRKSKLVPSTYVDLDKIKGKEMIIETNKNNIQTVRNPVDEAAAAKALLFDSNVNAPVEIRVKIENDDNGDWWKDLEPKSETTGAVTSDVSQDKDIKLDVANGSVIKDDDCAKDDGNVFVIDSKNFKNILNEYINTNKKEEDSMIDDTSNLKNCKSYKRKRNNDRVSDEIGKVVKANDVVDDNNDAKFNNRNAVTEVVEANMAPVFGEPSKIITYKKLAPKYKMYSDAIVNKLIKQNFIAAAREYCSEHNDTISQDFVDSVKLCLNLLDKYPDLEIVCTVCDKGFTSLPSFQTHLNELHNNEPNKLNVSTIVTKQRLIIAARDLKTIICDPTYIDNCLAKAMTEVKIANLWYKVEMSIQSYKCYVCSKSWEHYTPFKNHFFLHHDIMEIELHPEITQRYASVKILDMRQYGLKNIHVATKWVNDSADPPKSLPLYSDEGALIYRCFYCGTYFENAGSLSEHCLNVAKCVGCNYEAACPFMKRHENKCNFFFSKTLPKTCQCGAILTSKTELVQHRKVCTRGSHMLAFHCHICKDRVTTIDLLVAHMKEKHVVRSDEYIPSRKCNVTNPGLLSCPHCWKQFKNKGELMTHKSYNRHRVQCEQCAVVLKKKCMLLEHQITEHISDRMIVFVCCLCAEMRLTYETLHQHYILDHFENIGLFATNDNSVSWKKIFPLKREILVSNDKCFFANVGATNSKPKDSVVKVTNTTDKEKIEGVVTKDKDKLLCNDVGNEEDSQNNVNKETSDDTTTEIELEKDDQIVAEKAGNENTNKSPVLQEISNDIHDNVDTIKSENMREITNQKHEVLSSTTADTEMEDDHKPNIADVCESYDQNSHTMEDEDIKPDISELNKALQLATNTDAQTYEIEKEQQNTDIVIKKEIDCDKPEDSGNTRKHDINASYLALIRAIIDPEEVKQEDQIEITDDAINIPGTSQMVLSTHTSNGYILELANGIKLETKEDVTVRDSDNSPSELTIDQFIQNNSEVTIPEVDHLEDETDDSGDKVTHKLYTCKKCNFTGPHRKYKDHKKNDCWTRKKAKTGYIPKTTALFFTKYNCSKCCSVFGTLSKYTTHMVRHNYSRKCPECDKEFDYKQTLNSHIINHLRNNYQKVYSLKSEENEPKLTGVMYQCEKCNKHVKKQLLWKHWEAHLVIGQKAPKVKEEPNTDIPKNTNPNIRYCIQELTCQIVKGKKMTCKLCKGREFTRIGEIKRHLIVHLVRDALTNKSINGNLKCQICEKGVETVGQFKTHLRIHGKLALYECQLCSKQFGDSSNFAKHKKIHNLRVMYCDLCKRKFQTKKQLIVHIAKHDNGAKMKCEHCDKIFYFNSDLKRHLKMVHRVGPVLYSCVICGEKFRWFKEKYNHEWEVHKVRKIKVDCPICNEQFRKFHDLKKHIGNYHPGYHLDKKMYELLSKINQSNLPIGEVEKILCDRLKGDSASTSGTGE